MRRHSSGSSGDDDTSPAEPSHANSPDSQTKHHRLSAPQSAKLDRRRSTDRRTSISISHRSSSINWRTPDSRNATIEKLASPSCASPSPSLGLILTANGVVAAEDMGTEQEPRLVGRRPQCRSPWAISSFALAASLIGLGLLFAILHSSVTRQVDPKGCRMSYMRPSYAKLDDFDTEHTRLAGKYSLYLYREQGIDRDTKV